MMGIQGLFEEMARLELVAQEADTRREMLENVRSFVGEISESGCFVATAWLSDDTIMIEIRPGGQSAPPVADPAPQPITTDPAEAFHAEVDIEVADVPAAQEEQGPTAPAEGGGEPVPDAPEVQEPPEPVKRAARMPVPTYVSGPYSDEETASFERMAEQGLGSADIAAELGRKPNAVSVKLSNWRKAAKGGDAPDVELHPGWAVHLDALGNDSRFDVETDMKLAGYMAKKAGIGGAAALLRIKRDVVEARWKALSDTPFPFSVEGLTEALSQRFSETR